MIHHFFLGSTFLAATTGAGVTAGLVTGLIGALVSGFDLVTAGLTSFWTTTGASTLEAFLSLISALRLAAQTS